MNDNVKKLLSNFYDTNKIAVNLTGVIGAIAGIFLQIDNFDDQNLRMVQFAFLSLFSLLIVYLTFKSWKMLIQSSKGFSSYFLEITWSLILVGMNISLFAFIFNAYKSEIFLYLRLLIFTVGFYIYYYFDEIWKNFFGEQNEIRHLGKSAYFAFMFTILPSLTIAFENPRLGYSNLFLFLAVFLISILREFNLISRTSFNVLYPVIFIIFVGILLILYIAS